ncbi:hypothetical protein G9A89_001835 [Geosiphon pyriformis]|nr:hypothetical protein G9A89_001835 [Geosiphon pyriformis]
MQKELREIQADGSVHAAYIDPDKFTQLTSKRKKKKAKRFDKAVACIWEKMMCLQSEIRQKAITFLFVNL